MKVFICDDESARAEYWAASISELEVREIIVPSPEELQDAIRALEDRRAKLRESKLPVGDSCLIDEADLFIVDYDLLHLKEGVGYLTGDKIAYLARVFSSAGYIVVVNQFRTNEFDLTGLIDEASKADFNIGGDQLDNPGLWTHQWNGSYRPWHWPLLPEAAKKHSARVQELMAGGLDETILPFLGFNEDKLAYLSDPAKSFISRKGASQREDGAKELMEITFRDFALDYSEYLEPKDAEEVRKLVGMDDQLSRIAAAGVHKWLERKVVFEQNLLVDIPHLLERLPQISIGGELTADDFSRLVSFEAGESLHAGLQAHKFQNQNWTSRDVFWWPDIGNDDGLIDVATSDGREFEEFIFREDVSNFGSRDNSREFKSGADGYFNRRYVSDGTKAEGVDDGAPEDASSVVYAPAARLAT